MSDKLSKAVEALRKKENDKIIKWEAEMVFILEKYKNETIINELTDNMSIYEYLSTLIPKIDYTVSNNIQNWIDADREITAAYAIKQFSSSEAKHETVIKIKCLVNYITNIKKSSAYLEKEKLRKEEYQIESDEAKEGKEKKGREIEKIQRQIAELQAKLASLQS
jgi:hypothetical protein